MNEKPVRAVIYLRISQDPNEDGLALERQLRECEEIAKARSWEIIDTYSDTVSASKRNVTRPSYDQMFNDFRRGKFEALICWDLDRLTRQPRQLEDWIEAAEGGLLLVTGDGQVDLSTENGRMFARIKATIARTEIELKGKRQKAKNLQLIQSGRPVPGRRRFGYQSDNMTPEPNAAKVVEQIFMDFDQGVTVYTIAKGLGWRTGRVRETLTNRAYIGEVKHLGEFHPSEKISPLVDIELFERVQIKLSDPTRKTSPGNEIKHLLSGLARCGVCGAKMFYRRGYVCKESTSHAQCEKYYVENTVMWKTLEWVTKNQGDELLKNGSQEVVDLINQSREIERQLNEAIDLAIELGPEKPAHLKRRIAELSVAKEKLAGSIISERAAHSQLQAIERVHSLWHAHVSLDNFSTWKQQILNSATDESSIPDEELGEGHYTFTMRHLEVRKGWERFWDSLDLATKRDFIDSLFDVVIQKGPRAEGKIQVTHKI